MLRIMMVNGNSLEIVSEYIFSHEWTYNASSSLFFD